MTLGALAREASKTSRAVLEHNNHRPGQSGPADREPSAVSCRLLWRNRRTDVEDFGSDRLQHRLRQMPRTRKGTVPRQVESGESQVRTSPFPLSPLPWTVPGDSPGCVPSRRAAAIAAVIATVIMAAIVAFIIAVIMALFMAVFMAPIMTFIMVPLTAACGAGIIVRVIVRTAVWVMVVITVSITIAITASVTVISAISDTTAITVQAMAATTTWYTTGDMTPIPELSATR